jgi:hypothetical protein
MQLEIRNSQTLSLRFLVLVLQPSSCIRNHVLISAGSVKQTVCDSLSTPSKVSQRLKPFNKSSECKIWCNFGHAVAILNSDLAIAQRTD